MKRLTAIKTSSKWQYWGEYAPFFVWVAYDGRNPYWQVTYDRDKAPSENAGGYNNLESLLKLKGAQP